MSACRPDVNCPCVLNAPQALEKSRKQMRKRLTLLIDSYCRGDLSHHAACPLAALHRSSCTAFCLAKDPGEADDFDTDIEGAIFSRRQRWRRLMHERNSLAGRYLLLDPKIFRSTGVIASRVKIVVPTPRIEHLQIDSVDSL